MKLRLVKSLIALSALAAAASAAEFRFENQTLTVPDGFTVQRVAGPPLVDRPINMAFDEEGALYVTDSSGSNAKPDEQLKNPTHRVVKLLDRDGDGIFEDRTVFADKLPFPEGAMWHDGSLYVAAPPVIWKLSDTDGDGLSDKRETWFDGKTLTNCANDLHGPYAGQDGYIYWCKGAWAEQRHRLTDGRDFVTRASHVFRQRPDGSGREVVITGGMDNPIDVAFSPEGERFLSNTFIVHPGNGQRDGLLHAVHGGVWGKEHGPLEGHPRTGALMPIMTHLGPAAASGLEIPRSNALGLRGELLCTQFNMRKISRHTLVPDGATFTTKDADFLVSSHTDFHATDIVEDADGSLLVADTGGWYKLCCPTSKEEKPAVLGAIYRIRKTGAPTIADPRGTKLDWKNPPLAELVARLDDPRHAVAERAVAAAAARGEQSVPLLAEKETLNAVWALTRIHTPTARAAVAAKFRVKDEAVQFAALTSAALWRDRAASAAARELLASGSPRVRRAAAELAGRAGDRGAIPLLLAAAPDRFSQHAAAYALYEIGGELPAGPLAEVAKKMLALPKPAMSPALPLLSPAAKPAPELVKAQLARLDELTASTKGGDATRGAEIFRSTKAQCANCHAVSGTGGTLGPDLTKIGAIRTRRDLLEAIAFPSTSYVRGYEPVVMKLHGEEVFGIIKNETQDALTLATGPTTEVRVPRKTVTAIAEAPVSLMPPGLDAVLTPQELADLVAYLESAK